MLNMENAEEVMQILERFTRLKQKEIPKELDDYMHYVAKTGDTVFKWSSLKYLFREKLLNVIKNFHDTSPRVDDLPQYPNVDPFNYESMKSSLLERLELFTAAPFSVQRLCELLTEPRKQYSRIDKFMRALEKNILVSTIEPGRKRTESENGDSLDSVVNGDVSLDVNVDIDMENDTIFNAETQSNATSSSTPASQPSSNLAHKPDDDILPNPKKPKLDLDDAHDAETEAATKSIINSKTDSPASESSLDKAIADEPTTTDNVIDMKKKEEESAAEESNVVVSEEKPPAEGKQTIENKESETEKMDVAVHTDGKSEEVIEKKAEEKAEPGAVSGEGVEKGAATIATTVATVAISAADDVDIAEVEEKKYDEEKKKDCSKEILEKQEVVKEKVEKSIKENAADEKAENGDLKNDEKTETTITTTNTEKTNEKQTESASAEKTAASNTEEKISQDKAEAIPAANSAEGAVEKPKDDVKVSKAEVVSSTVPEEPLKSDEPKSSEIEVASLPSSAEEAKELPSGEKAVEAGKKVDAADQPPPATTDSSKIESLEIPVEIQSAVADQNDKETEKASDVAAVAAEAESNDTTLPVLLEVPIVTIDQPMDENQESIAEAEPVVPVIIIEAAANVEEVVMGGDSVEMATDANEPAKDEPAGMEVDDTSQEAMDQ